MSGGPVRFRVVVTLTALAALGVMALVLARHPTRQSLPAATASPSPTVNPTGLQTENPPGRVDFGMAYDEGRKQVVVFGGLGRQTYTSGLPREELGDTWVWDGTGWSEKHPSAAPRRSSSNAMAYDQNSGRVILYGGGTRSETWSWDGETWTSLHPAVNPGPRTSPLMAWDPVRKLVLLQGGFGRPNEVFFDTWSWNGSNWRKLDVTPPTDRCCPSALAFEPISRRMLLYGGVSGVTGNVWLLTNEGWTKISYTDPSPGGLLWTDDVLGRVVLLGGSVGSATGSKGTWTWIGSRWELHQTWPNAPTLRLRAGAVFDGARHTGVLFGGASSDPYGNEYLPDDTWTWQPEMGWRQVVRLRAQPQFRAGFVLEFNSAPLAGDVFHLSIIWQDGKREEADLCGGPARPCVSPYGGSLGSYAAQPREPDPEGGAATYRVTRLRGGVETVIESGVIDVVHSKMYRVTYTG